MAHVEVTKAKLLEAMQKGVNLKELSETVDGIADLVTAKNHDYGDAWQRYGIFTPLIRINDKILRVKTLSGGAQALVADEGIKDTLKDIIGYAALALMWLDEQEVQETIAQASTQGDYQLEMFKE